MQGWIAAVGAKTAYITPGSPWESGFIESFNGRLREEPLEGEIFFTLREAQIVIGSWRRHYDAERPHASIGYRAPALEVSYRRSPHGRLRYRDKLRRSCGVGHMQRRHVDSKVPDAINKSCGEARDMSLGSRRGASPATTRSPPNSVGSVYRHHRAAGRNGTAPASVICAVG